MDFAAALANLEKSAKAAAANTGNGSSSNNSQHRREGDRRRGRQDQQGNDQRNSRPRYNDHPASENRERGRYENSDRPEGMSRFGYRVNPYRSTVSPEAPSDIANSPKHIALLVICIDEVPFEHLWKAWAAAGDALVSVIVHAKYPDRVQSKWLQQRLLLRPPRIGRGNCYADPECLTHAPQWGSVQITRAMVDLLATGLKVGPTDREADVRFSTKRFLVKGKEQGPPEEIPLVDKFIFVSETCLPVRTLKECVELLFEEPKVAAKSGESDAPSAVVPAAGARPNEMSWINARNLNSPDTPKNKYERDQFQDIHRMVPRQFRWKADQWTVLSRPHAAAVMNIDQHMRPADQLWNSFARINASDEMYFPTALACLGILKEDDEKDTATSQVAKRAVTYTDWTEGMRNPATYTNGVRDLRKVAKIARKQGCLFARKFALIHNIPGREKVVTGEIDADAWTELLEALRKEEGENQP